MFGLRRKKRTLTLQAETALATPDHIDLYIPPSNYKATQRRLKRTHLEDIHPSIIMNSNIQKPISGTKVYRYTGFPEPFNAGEGFLLEVGLYAMADSSNR
jgi:hypothetical protein